MKLLKRQIITITLKQQLFYIKNLVTKIHYIYNFRYRVLCVLNYDNNNVNCSL